MTFIKKGSLSEDPDKTRYMSLTESLDLEDLQRWLRIRQSRAGNRAIGMIEYASQDMFNEWELLKSALESRGIADIEWSHFAIWVTDQDIERILTERRRDSRINGLIKENG
jgi:hypothetical protein